MKVAKTKTKIWKGEEFLVLGLKVKHVIFGTWAKCETRHYSSDQIHCNPKVS